ncbi:hypothetical protein [Celerinatantimonas yamalensis]|uniref:Lipoprotein SmpA/OmlA domain-containing protein n=1 Tax=Celerinatantimonas yamalensis TaxID=559956 RepID=A0ABW9G3Y9_9GAMM
MQLFKGEALDLHGALHWFMDGRMADDKRTPMTQFKYSMMFPVLLLCSLLLAGCTLLGGTTITDSKVAQIERNYTSDDELLQMFGQPYIKMTEGNNRQRWTYYSDTADNQSSWFRSSAQHKTLIILLADGVVRDYRYTKN